MLTVNCVISKKFAEENLVSFYRGEFAEEN